MAPQRPEGDEQEERGEQERCKKQFAVSAEEAKLITVGGVDPRKVNPDKLEECSLMDLISCENNGMVLLSRNDYDDLRTWHNDVEAKKEREIQEAEEEAERRRQEQEREKAEQDRKFFHPDADFAGLDLMTELNMQVLMSQEASALSGSSRELTEETSSALSSSQVEAAKVEEEDFFEAQRRRIYGEEKRRQAEKKQHEEDVIQAHNSGQTLRYYVEGRLQRQHTLEELVTNRSKLDLQAKEENTRMEKKALGGVEFPKWMREDTDPEQGEEVECPVCHKKVHSGLNWTKDPKHNKCFERMLARRFEGLESSARAVEATQVAADADDMKETFV